MTKVNQTTKSKLNPAPGVLVIEPSVAQHQTTSGIFLPDSSGEKPQKGKVLAVGIDELLDNGSTRKSFVNVGDVVIYKKWGGNEVKIDGKELLFVKFDDVLAVVVEK